MAGGNKSDRGFTCSVYRPATSVSWLISLAGERGATSTMDIRNFKWEAS